MERKYLEGLGLEKETIDKVMAEYGKSIEKQKQQITDLTTERDGIKSQYDDALAKLKAFDGKDPDALAKKITELEEEKVKIQTDHANVIAERDFADIINAQISAAGARDVTDIKANLDLDALRQSKNQKDDVAAAVAALRESKAYLFKDETKESTDDDPAAVISTGGKHKEPGAGGEADAFTRGAMQGAGLDTGKGDK